ncbi:DUF4890 domain-containing protein [Pontibacter flavimaris]|uniref:DUF4890 domain-containing protein n=1 Tax=Pontibacter flavimaris TaxID=1797110 RepID=A0A1Q5PG48_9BACT|nr:DUF4890 domain-containing protein [Pontibacter flavimaris]OKL41197.1 hypothetical protein A3841_15370 [Pontibacter flavimaris]
MKKKLLALALGVLVMGSTVAPAVAQDTTKPRQEASMRKHKGERKSPEERAEARAERMTRELDLNKSQAKKVEVLYLKEAKEREAKHANFKKADKRDTASRKQMRTEMMAAHQRHNEELKDILNKKQYARYEEMQAKKREQMKARHQEKGGKGKRGHHERGSMQESR